MLIKETYTDILTSYGTTMRVFVYHPVIPGYPKAKFPGVLVYSEIYQVTGPVSRLAKQIAGQGFIVAAPSVYHNFESWEALPYDGPGTDKGNDYKVEKPLESYDEDATLAIDYLTSLPTCNGKIGATGMCLGGHIAFRAAFDRRVKAAVCFFGTDIHSATLGKGQNDDSLKRAKEIKGELLMIFGTLDPHVPLEGRDLIRKTLYEAGVFFSFWEVAGAQHAFVRDENSKGRYDPAVTKLGLEMLYEMFNRTLKLDLGDHDGEETKPDTVC
ncbi:Alpha/Beta hydrolase protein [Lipomyces tetrasporus]|uniref:Alpha/Beta hydrolase protein n=1 Tax=Lipomyces tetrasporus TaxID=54092 RepID=A0AAD7VW63_9ASCO|nr:Alpha/Beta hydrolase protein [Lipomyces tetrasporus]KAJ8103796.1 Alpha/Beta hydrolase protein [Lipomyces tetrasporus]